MVRIDPVTPAIGASIQGLDFSQPTHDEIYNALLQHLVVFYGVAENGISGAERLNGNVPRVGHNVRPLVGTHAVTGRKFLNFNEAFVTHILGLTSNDSNSLRTFLANHMNKPEDQVGWRWSAGDLAMWDNRVTMHHAPCTMHHALAEYCPRIVVGIALQ